MVKSYSEADGLLDRARVDLVDAATPCGEAVRAWILPQELREAVDTAKTLSGLLPICAECKKIRDDLGMWQPLERYISARSEADFTHGYCPTCVEHVIAESNSAS